MSSQTRHLDQYRLLRSLESEDGQITELFEAELLGINDFRKRLALKLLGPSLRSQPLVRERFAAAGARAANLTHPNMVAVHGVGRAKGTDYLALEYVGGWRLQHLIDRGRQAGRRFPVNAAAYLLREIAKALQYLHEQRPPVAHGDVTPHNMFVSGDGQVKLGDFSTAKATQHMLEADAAAVVFGRLPYIAPEVADGEPASPAADVYAAGLVLFELLTGCRYNAAQTV